MSARGVLLLLLTAALGVAAMIWTRDRRSAGPVGARATEESVPGAELTAARTAAPPPRRTWWLEKDVESLDPRLRTARLEAHWWASRPAPPYEKPDAVFAIDVDLVEGRARARLTGNDRPGFVVLFVVEATGRSLAHPYGDPVDEVEPGSGYGPPIASWGPVPILVNARVLALRALDRDDRPLEGVEVLVREEWVQGQRSDRDGRVRFTGLRGPQVEVSWSVPRALSAGHGIFREYADGAWRLLEVPGEESILRIPRNPRIRLRARVEGAPESAWCALAGAKVLGVEAAGAESNFWHKAPASAPGIFLLPGRWQCSGSVLGGLGEAVTVETPVLTLDTVTTVEVPVVVPRTLSRLEIAFDVRGDLNDPRLAAAVELRNVATSGGWNGVQAAAPHDELLVFALSGTYEVTGAIRARGLVRFSAPRLVTLREAEQGRVLLYTEPAGGVRIPAAPLAQRHETLELLEREFPRTGVLEEDRFGFVWLGSRDRNATWWMPAGSWTLVQRDGADVEWGRLALQLEPGGVVTLTRDAAGRLSVPP